MYPARVFRSVRDDSERRLHSVVDWEHFVTGGTPSAVCKTDMTKSSEHSKLLGKRERYLSPLIWALVLLLIPAKTMAEVRNDPRVFGDGRACEAYVEFLEEGPRIGTTPCHVLETFIVSNSGISDEVFLFELSLVSGFETALRALVETNIAVMQKDPASYFVLSELAGRSLAIQMALGGDEERSSLYAVVMYRIQVDALYKMCASNIDCFQIPETNDVSDILGVEFDHLDQLDSSRLALCLNRTDAYSVPIRMLLRSDAFEDCISSRS